MGKFSIIKTKIKETLAEAVAHIAATKVIFISTFIAFVFACVDVCSLYEYGKNVSVWEDLYLAFFMAAVFAMPATLLTQKFTALKKYLIQSGVAVAGALLGFFSHRGFGNSVYSSLYYYGILFAAVLITLYLFIPKGNSRTYFSLVFKHALFCSFMTLVFMGGLLLLVYAVQNLILNTDNNDVYECSCFFCAFIFGVNTFTYYLFNRREDESSGKAFKVITLYILFPVFAVLILILYIYLLKALFLFKLPNGQINWFVSFASCFYIVFYFILREYDELPVIKFFYKFGAFVFIPLIFMGGLLLLVYAVQNLILNTDNNDVYECSCFFCAFIFGVNTFTYYLFNRREDESSGKAFKVITLYILFPVFAVLILILYIYLLKALFLFKLPNGQINWFVSFASCFYIVFYFILREYDELPVIKFFYKFGAFVFIPLILIQIYAYFIRVNAYGFTGYRYSSLLFIIFSIITITLTFIKKGKYVNWAIIALTAIVLYDSVTPFNLINMAHKSQFSRMVKVMNKYDIYDEETDTLKLYDPDALEAAISDDDRAALYSAYRYILWTSDLPQPEWATKVEYDEDGQRHTEYLYFEEVFGIKTTRADEKILEFEKSFYDKILNIEPYKEFSEIKDSKWSSEYKDGDYIEYLREMPEIVFYSKTGKKYCLEEFFFTINQNVSEDEPLWYIPDDEIAFCFKRIEYKYNTERKLFKNYYYNGYVFYK